MSTDDGRFAGVDTASLTVSRIQQSDEGNYRCTVSNRLGKVTSKLACLTISKLILELVLLPVTFSHCLWAHTLDYHT